MKLKFLYLLLFTLFLTQQNLVAQVFGNAEVLISDTGEEFLSDGLIAADVDADGFPDFVGRTGIFFNDGNNVFSLNTEFPSNSDRVVAVVDIDNDGNLDVVLTNFILLNDGTASDFTILTSLFQNSGNNSIAKVGDFNNDNLPDFVAVRLVTFYDDELTVYLNNGDQTFTAAYTDDVFDNGYVNTVDWNDDGLLDIISAESNFDTDAVLIYENNGGTTFNKSMIPMGDSFNDDFIDAQDLDKDGDLDLVFSGSFSSLMMAENNNGNFDNTNQISFERHTWINVDDANEDGYPDILTIKTENEDFEVGYYLNNGNGDFENFVSLTTITGTSSILSQFANDFDNGIYLTDFNNDPVPDLIANAALDGEVLYFENLTPPSATTDINNEIAVELYPNPTADFISINTAELVMLRVDILSVYQTIESTIELNNTSVDISVEHLPAGIYFLQIETKEGSVVKRFLKQ